MHSVEDVYTDEESDEWSGFWSNSGFDETDKTVTEVNLDRYCSDTRCTGREG